MAYTIDPAFRKAKTQARKRRRRRLFLRLGGATAVLAALSGVGLWWIGRSDADLDAELAMVPTETVVPDPSVQQARIRAMLNLRRAPMMLHVEETGDQAMRELALPAGQPLIRDGRPEPAPISLLQDDLLTAGRNLVLQLPSGRDDFALFQAQRRDALEAAQEEGRNTLLARDASVALTIPSTRRSALFNDEIIVLNTDRSLRDVLVDSGIDAAQAESIASATIRIGELDETLVAGSVVALRSRNRAGQADTPLLLQLSLYGPDRFLVSLAQNGPGRFASAADPWAEKDLLQRSGQLVSTEMPGRNVRLMDALYSTALRNGVPTGIVGELIVMMSRRFDLERLAEQGDRITLLFSGQPDTGSAGQILYAGIEGPSGEMRCYVTALPGPEGGFGCFDAGEAGVSGMRLGAGLAIPVRGVKTSGFGMRMHPILKKMKPHNGVDWAAPEGTPIFAARAGTIRAAGDSGGYGNLVAITHEGDMETRYAHMQRFADGIAPGVTVAAGQQIGYVGTTGRSTGPHLHFELWVDGRPTDPAQYGSSAVASLVDRIIHVESGGNATAQNPLSSATGAGQFISSTWVRMMNTYRPDLVEQLTREELLDLRNDPVLSRDMVQRLAQESESYLRARGHQVTAGRLYLAHFLGAAGANQALSSDPNLSVEEVMGAGVVSANPFLRGKNISDLLAWADRKMQSRGQRVAVVIPPQVKAYMTRIDALLADL